MIIASEKSDFAISDNLVIAEKLFINELLKLLRLFESQSEKYFYFHYIKNGCPTVYQLKNSQNTV